MNTLIAAALLTFTSNNGTVAPEFQKHYTCTINSGLTTKVLRAPMIALSHNGPAKTQYNQEIPNVTVLKSLILEASRFNPEMNPAPIGGAMTSYTATLPNKGHTEITLKTMYGKTLVTTLNTSPAAQKLVRFMDANCN